MLQFLSHFIYGRRIASFNPHRSNGIWREKWDWAVVSGFGENLMRRGLVLAGEDINDSW